MKKLFRRIGNFLSTGRPLHPSDAPTLTVPPIEILEAQRVRELSFEVLGDEEYHSIMEQIKEAAKEGEIKLVLPMVLNGKNQPFHAATAARLAKEGFQCGYDEKVVGKGNNAKVIKRMAIIWAQTSQ